jgi:predicted  nucleic acid-binding Zn-ribbon protein
MKLSRLIYIFVLLCGGLTGPAKAQLCSESLTIRFSDGTRGCFNQLWFADRVPWEYKHSLINLVHLNYPSQGYAVAMSKNARAEQSHFAFLTFPRVPEVSAVRAQLIQQVVQDCQRIGDRCELAIFDGEVQIETVSARNTPESIRTLIGAAQAKAQEDAAKMATLQAEILSLQNEKRLLVNQMAEKERALDQRHEQVLRVSRAKSDQDLAAARSEIARLKTAIAGKDKQLLEAENKRQVAEKQREQELIALKNDFAQKASGQESVIAGLQTNAKSLQEEITRLRLEVAAAASIRPAESLVTHPGHAVSPASTVASSDPSAVRWNLPPGEWTAVRGLLPLQQLQFCQAVTAYNQDLFAAQNLRNEVRLTVAKTRRDAALSTIAPDRRFHHWVAQVKSLRLAKDGSASVVLSLPCGVAFGSFACGSEIRGTIPASSALFQQVADLGVGDFLVDVSGVILSQNTLGVPAAPSWPGMPVSGHCDAGVLDAGVSEFFVVALESFAKKR